MAVSSEGSGPGKILEPPKTFLLGYFGAILTVVTQALEPSQLYKVER